MRIVGRDEVYVENHRGILSYGEDEILLSGGRVMIRVRGTSLRLRSMTAEDLVKPDSSRRWSWSRRAQDIVGA